MKLFSNKEFFKKLKAKALDRKGLGMELAVMLLLVVLGCSMIMVSSALYGRNILQTKEQQIMQRLEIDEFAESYLKDDSVTHEKFIGVPSGNVYTIYLKNADGNAGKKVLEITLEDNKIKTWTYTGE